MRFSFRALSFRFLGRFRARKRRSVERKIGETPINRADLPPPQLRFWRFLAPWRDTVYCKTGQKQGGFARMQGKHSRFSGGAGDGLERRSHPQA
jgi:hypothetical protein